MFQLVGDGVRVFNPRDEGTWYDADGVREKFGVPPGQVVDVLALMGDAIDNIKGVPGIGDKGARELITTFGSLDALLERAGEVTQKKYREALTADADLARQSRELARIRRDAPVTFDIEAFRYRGPNRQACFELFGELGFRSLLERVRADRGDRRPRTTRSSRRLEAVHALAAELRAAGRFALRDAAPRPGRRCRPTSSASRSPRATGRRATSRWRTTRSTPARSPTVARPLDRAEGRARGPGGREGRPRPEVRRDRARALRRDAARPRRSTRCSPATCSTRRGRRTRSRTARSSTWATRRSTEEDVCGRGAKALALADLPPAAVLDYAGERADLPCSSPDALAPDARGRAARRGLPRPGAAADPGARRHRTRRRQGRLRRARAAVGAPRARAGRPQREDLRAGRRVVQHQLAQAAVGGPLRQAEAAGRQADGKDAGGVDGRRRARGAGARARAAAPDPRVAQRCRSSRAPTSTRCRSSSTRRRAASTPASTRPWRPPAG